MKKVFAFVLCMIMVFAQTAFVLAESEENPLDWHFYSLSYAYIEDGVQKHYNPSSSALSKELIAEIRTVLKDAVKNPSAEKPENLGFRRIAITFSSTDEPEKQGNDHVRCVYDLCDNGIRITRQNANWTDTPEELVPEIGEEFVQTPNEESATQYVSYTDTNASRKIGELLNSYMGGNAVYPYFEFITNLNFLYEASISLYEKGANSGLYYWGMADYNIKCNTKKE